MDTHAFSEHSAIPSTSTRSPSSWSIAGNHRVADLPGLPSYASLILNFDSAPTFQQTRFHGEHFSREQTQSGSRYASPYANRSPHTGSATDSPFLSANSPFLSEHPTESKRNIHTPPPFNLEPLVSGWSASTNDELFVNVSDLTSARSSSANSPIAAVLYKSAQHSSPRHYQRYVNTDQTLYRPNSPGKRKSPPNVLSSPSSPRPKSHDAAESSSPESGSAYASSHNGDESYSDDSDSLYVPSPGRSRRSRPSKRARVSEDSNQYEFVVQDGKKSRGRKVPITQEFGAVEGSGAQVTALPSIPYGIKKIGSPNKNKRRYVCTFEGCGKCFVRGEHLKRHVKSLHLTEKPHECTFSGCTKSFSRKDNLKQHINIFHS